MKSIISVGSDEISIPKVLEIALIIVGVGVLAFFGTNIDRSTVRQDPDTFWKLGITSLVIIGLGFIITKVSAGKLDINSILWEKGLAQIPPKFDKILFIIFVLLGLFTFFYIGLSGTDEEGNKIAYAIDAPFYSIAPVKANALGRGILSFFAAHQEDVFFFGVLPGVIFAVSLFITKNPWASIIITIILIPSIFTAFHASVLGIADVVGIVVTFIFGLEQILVGIFVGKLFYSHMRHGFNNLGKVIFQEMSMLSFFIMILNSWWFWGIALVVGLVVVLRMKAFGGIK